MGLSNLSVKARLFFTIGLLAAALLIVGLLGLRALKQSNSELNQVYGNNLMSSMWINQIASLSRDNVLTLDDALISGDPAALVKFREQSERNNKIILDTWAKYDATEMGPGEKDAADRFKRNRDVYRQVRNSIADDISAGNIDQARKRRTSELQQPIADMIEAAEELIALQAQFASEAIKQAEGDYRQANVIAWTSI